MSRGVGPQRRLFNPFSGLRLLPPRKTIQAIAFPSRRRRAIAASNKGRPFFLSAERDAFDTLFDHAPDKLNVVKKVGLLPPRAALKGFRPSNYFDLSLTRGLTQTLSIVQTLVTFVNKHLNKLNLEVSELDTQVGCAIVSGLVLEPIRAS